MRPRCCSGTCATRPTPPAPGVERDAQSLLTAAVDEHDAAQRRVLAALRTSRYLDLVDRLVQGAMTPRMRPSAASATSRDLARLVRRPWKRLAKAHAALGDDPSDPELHALRIRAKRARYAVEAIAGAVGGDEPRKFAAALADLQDVLGNHQDAVVATTWIHEHSTGADPGEAYAAGVLTGLLRADAQAARDALPDAWHREPAPVADLPEPVSGQKSGPREASCRCPVAGNRIEVLLVHRQ